MKTLLLAGALLLPLAMCGQFSSSYHTNFLSAEERPCAGDSSQTVVQPVDWVLYQTLNDRWDGPVDSSQCISGQQGSNGFMLYAGDFDYSRPLFARHLFEEAPTLFPNELFLLRGAIWNVDLFQLGTSQDGEMHSGTIIQFQIPDETGDSTALRTHEAPFEGNPEYSFSNCIPTEYFQENMLSTLVLKLTLDSLTSAQDSFKYQWVDLELAWASRVLDLTLSENYLSNGVYKVDLIDGAWGGGSNMLVLYPDTSLYPSSANRLYKEATPSPNPDTPVAIELIVNEYESLTFQPFTGFRGALVEGSDSLRHPLELIFKGGNICMDFIIDLVFPPGTGLEYRSGQIELAGQACMMFLDGSQLQVGEGSLLHYGSRGNGILALHPGAAVELAPNSTLLIDNELRLIEIFGRGNVVVDLQPGRRLAFGPGARLRRYSEVGPPEALLEIHMNGGELDLGPLTPKERKLIRLVYPSSQNAGQPILLFPNPAADYLTTSFEAPAEGRYRWRIFDQSGRPVREGQFSLQKGPHSLPLQVQGLPSGLYVLQLSGGGERLRGRFVKY